MKKLFSKNFVKYSCISRVFKKTLYNSFTRVLVKLKFWFHEIYICILLLFVFLEEKTRENSNMREKKRTNDVIHTTVQPHYHHMKNKMKLFVSY